MYSSILRLLLLLLSTLSSCTPVVVRETTLASSAVPISKITVSLGIEFCYIVDYLGDIEGSSKLSKRLLQNIQDIRGESPIIRIGGHTQDAAQETITNIFVPGNLEAVSVTYNKDLFSVLNNHVPSNQKFIFGLNLGQDNETFPQAEVDAAEKYLRDSGILSYELGNEPDFYGASQRPGAWNVQNYVVQIIDWIQQIQSVTKTKRNWQISALTQLIVYQGNFSIPEIITLGVPQAIKAVTLYSDHNYPYSIFDPTRAAFVSLEGLMNHTTTAAHDANTLFYMGETGSVSCHGEDGVSNTMGAALWELDYVLNGAVLGMDGVFFHMCTPSFYSMWQPVEYNGTAARVYPTYNALIVIAVTMSDFKLPYVASVPSPSGMPNLAIYAIYSATTTSLSTAPTKLILFNLNYCPLNSTSPRPTETIYGWGANAVSGVTFGRLTWENGGVVSGDKVYEQARGGAAVVGDSEGVVIEVI